MHIYSRTSYQELSREKGLRFILGLLSGVLFLPISNADTSFDDRESSEGYLQVTDANTSIKQSYAGLQFERHLGVSNFASSKAYSEPPKAPKTVVLPGAIEIEGDSLNLLLDRKMIASGNAMMRKGSQKVTGDTVSYDLQNDELEVIGNAKLLTGGSKVAGPSMRMRLGEQSGEMPYANIIMTKVADGPPKKNNSSLLKEETATLIADPKRYVDGNLKASNNYSSLSSKFSGSRADAKLIVFEGQDKKRLKDVRYTSCAPESNAWYIKASELELNDYSKSGSANNAFVEFLGVPIMYTPWMNFSYSDQRKSGLLAPTWGTTSRSGFEVLTPFYWNIRPNMDATLATRYLSKRGIQLQNEFRYLDDLYSGTMNLEYLPNDSISGQNRFYAKLAHIHTINQHWSAGYNLEKVSDGQYFSEMSTRIATTSRIILPQQAYLNYADSSSDGARTTNVNFLVQKYQTLDSVSYPYQRLPQITLTNTDDFKGLQAELMSQWVYFDRDSSAAKAATGSRAVAYPSISYPLANSYAFITPKLGVHTSKYNLNDNIPTGYTLEQNTISRTLPIASLDSGLYFDRATSLLGTNYTNTLEPRLFYTYIPYKDQSKIPIFDTALTDLNQTSLFTENQFSGQDRVNNANSLSMAVTSRLIDADTGIERIAAMIGQRYYFSSNKVFLPGTVSDNRNSSDIISGFSARLSSLWNLDAFLQYNPDQSELTRSNILARYNPEPGKVFNFSYRFNRDTLEQLNASAQWPFGHGWYGLGRVNYSIFDKTFVETIAGLEYDAGCWQARGVMQRIETATAEANYALFFQLELGGLTSIGANPLNILRRDIPGYQSSSDIPEFYRQQNIGR